MKKFSVIFLFFTLFLAGCATNTLDPAKQFRGQSEQQIFVGGERSMYKGNYNDAIKHFEALQALYPFGNHIQQASLDLIYSYYKNGDSPSALAAADRYIELYPMSANIDYAFYMRGLIEMEENIGFFERFFPVDLAQRNLEGQRQAFLDFNELVLRFPQSPYAADARQRMVFIRNLLAEHQVEVAQFYFDRQAYVAAVNRANEVIQHFQETPSVPTALVLMVQSYRALGLTQDANEALQVLQMNYPHDKRLLMLQNPNYVKPAWKFRL